MKKATRMENQIRSLTKANNLLRNQIDLTGKALHNNLAQLVDAAQQQSNLTSFNPIIQNNIYSPITLNWALLTYFYKTHGIIQTAMEIPVLDALRGGIDITSKEVSPDEIKDLQDYIEEIGLLDTMAETMVWVRLYGGGAIIINSNQNPEQPLTKKDLYKMEFYAANRWELQSPGTNPKIPWDMLGFGVPIDQEYFTFYGQKIHRSRVLVIPGKSAPYIIRWQLQGWGMSEVERMVEVFNKYIKTDNVIYDLLEEAKIDVIGIKGFRDQLLSAAGTRAMISRMEQMNSLKSTNRAILKDVDDTYDQKQLSFSGLAELTKENRIGIASALRIPMTKLFGISASGFNSGEDDIENYNAMVESEVRQKLRRPLRKLLRLLFIAKFGDEFDFNFEFKPLRVLGGKEEEEIKTSKQNRIHQNLDKGMYTPQEAAQAMEKEKLIEGGTAVASGMEPTPLRQDLNPGEEPGDKPGEGPGDKQEDRKDE